MRYSFGPSPHVELAATHGCVEARLYAGSALDRPPGFYRSRAADFPRELLPYAEHVERYAFSGGFTVMRVAVPLWTVGATLLAWPLIRRRRARRSDG